MTGVQVYAADRPLWTDSSAKWFRPAPLRRGGRHDVPQQFGEVAVRLVDLALPEGAVAVLHEVEDPLQRVGPAEILRVLAQAVIEAPGERLGADVLLGRQVDELAPHARPPGA